ncbi:MAG: hypothetical protein JWQ84_2370 [Mucilaginibacter sp.]|nr:hypothetical protein [Mucilaginibacter sp.]MDB5017538.1 hypothetical protein [Mucilaginibacter sp.]
MREFLSFRKKVIFYLIREWNITLGFWLLILAIEILLRLFKA